MEERFPHLLFFDSAFIVLVLAVGSMESSYYTDIQTECFQVAREVCRSSPVGV